MGSTAKMPTQPASNGVITGPPKGVVGGNRKKQKRRAKQAAKASTAPHGDPAAGLDYEEDPLGYGEEDDDYDYSEAEFQYDHMSPGAMTNGYSMPPPVGKKGKKKGGGGGLGGHDYNPELLGNNVLPSSTLPPPPNNGKGRRETIWNTSTQQERQNIKDFWLGLSEDERKSLLKIEKEAVLRKMKQQQKHSCSCTVCGRKRTAIEEELEVLYEGYYEELEQYAHHDHPPLSSADGMIPDPLQHKPHPLAQPPPHPHHRRSQLQEHLDDDEDFSLDEDDEDDYSDDEYSDDEVDPVMRSGVPDFFNFGQNLTVKGILTPWLEKLQSALKANPDNLLTVADDLLKNDGRKFIEMMEQLAERRLARESEAEYTSANPSHSGGYPPGDPSYHHEDPLAAGDEFDDDEASYDSQEEFDEDMDDEDSMGGLTEEQRMQEGRRMFQIFAARMFEQRVLTAYKEKVAAERQQKLLEELEDETKQEAQRAAKKEREAQKKKDKKKQQQQVKAEEKAKREAEKAAEDARIREAEEKKQEEQRRKKEEQRRKKDEEKKKQDEERAKKEAEKTRRQLEEQQKREEAERKAREQKATEKARKDEARKREREEREAREKEARERKAQEEQEKRAREEKAKTEKEAKEREKAAQQAAQPPTQPQQIQKRPSQPGMVAVPGVYPKQTTSGVSSPHPTVATPAIPKAPTPAKQRQPSQQGSLASSPKQSTSQVSSLPSKSSSPSSAGMPQQQPQAMVQPKTVLQKPGNQQPQQPASLPQQPSAVSSPPLGPPPGMTFPPQHHQQGGFAGPPMGYPNYQGPPGPMMQSNNMPQRGPMPMYPMQNQQMSSRFAAAGVNGPPPGMYPPQGRGMGYQHDGQGAIQAPPPGFPGQQQNTFPISTMLQPGSLPTQTHLHPSANNETLPPRASARSHSRQQSASEKERFESAANLNQPIGSARPVPIQRPSSVKPPQSHERRGSNTDLDDLSKHLGSSALLDDTDEPMPPNIVEDRRQPSLQNAQRNSQLGTIGSGLGNAPGFGTFKPPGLPFSGSSGLSQQSWGSLSNPSAMSSWNSNNAAFASNQNAFGSIGAPPMRPIGSTSTHNPIQLRLAVCTACKQLSAQGRGDGKGFHHIDLLMRQMQANDPSLNPPPALDQMEAICETEGHSQNGGGELFLRAEPSPPGGEKKFSVHFAETTTDLTGLGEIGSPMPGKAVPSSGFGAPGMGRGGAGAGGLGAVGSPTPSTTFS